MNNIKLLLILAVTALMAGCYEDKSTAGYKLVTPINIVDESPTDITIYSLDTLRINPIAYKEGQDDAKLTFSWTLYNGNITPTVIGTDMTLKTVMNFQPMGNAYTLVYRVTDPDSGLFVETKYAITIQSPFGTGLIVCDSEDGIVSDTHLCMSENFSYSFSAQDTVMRNLFSRVNERKIQGVITGAVSTYYQTFATLTISTPNSIERVDPRDYTFVDSDGKMFYRDPGNYNAQAVLNDANTGNDILIIDGKVYTRSFQQGNRLYGYHYSMPDMSPSYISAVHKPYWEDALCFDQIGGQFVSLDYSYNRYKNIVPAQSDYFPFTGYKDYDCISIFDAISDGGVIAVMKHKSTGRLYAYQFTSDRSSYPYRLSPQWIYELDPATCPDIDKAKFFCGTQLSQALYYATDTKIYAVNLSVPTDIITSEEYTTNEGETITHLYSFTHYRGGGYINITNSNPSATNPVQRIGSKNRMLVVSTYNESTREGFVNTVAVSNTGLGTLEKNREHHGRFDGFGRISITTFQEK